MARLPTPGGDDGTWGDILNAYLEVSHNSDGTLLPSAVTAAGAYAKPAGGIPKIDLASSIQASLSGADAAVQSVNGKTGTNITLAASDISAVPASQLGAASGVATLNSSSQLNSNQLPSTVVSDSSGINAPLVDGTGNHLVNIPSWQSSTLYPTGYVVQNGGVAYTASTTFTSGASFGADGANWMPLSSAELGVAIATSSFPSSPYVNYTTLTAVGLSLTVQVGPRPINVAFNANVQTVTANATYGTIAIYEDGTQIQKMNFETTAAQFSGPIISLSVRRNPTAGSHTYAMYASTTNASNTYWFLAATNAPATLQVVQV